MQNSPVTDALRLAVTQTVRALTQPAGIQAAATELRQQNAPAGRPTAALPLPGTSAQTAATQASASAAVELSPTALLPPVQLANQAAAARGATATPLTVAMLLVPHGLAQTQPGKPAHSTEALKLAVRLKQHAEGAQRLPNSAPSSHSPPAVGVSLQQAAAQYQSMSGQPQDPLMGLPAGTAESPPASAMPNAPSKSAVATLPDPEQSPAAEQTRAAQRSGAPLPSVPPSDGHAATRTPIRQDPDERLLSLAQRQDPVSGIPAASSNVLMPTAQPPSTPPGTSALPGTSAAPTPTQTAVLPRADLAYLKTAVPQDTRARLDVFKFDDEGGRALVPSARTLGATLHVELPNLGEVVVTLALTNRHVDIAVAGPAAAMTALKAQEESLLIGSDAWGVRVKNVSYVPFDTALRLP